MAEDVITTVVGIFLAIIILLVFVPVMLSVINSTSCQSYIQTIQQKDAEIASLNTQLTQIQTQLDSLNANYQRLISENITKKDIEDIKFDYNDTRTQINLLNQKFDTVNTSFSNVYNQYFILFSVSIVFNFFLVFLIIGDILAFSVLEIDIKKQIIGWVIEKVFKKHKAKGPRLPKEERTDEKDKLEVKEVG